MNDRNPMTLLDLQDLKEGGLYLSRYPVHKGILRGYFPFTVTEICKSWVRVMFLYPVRVRAGREILKGDEPAIFFQHLRTRAWTHYGKTTGDVPIQVGKLEGQEKAKYDQQMAYRKEWLKAETNCLPPTKFPMSSEDIEGIEKLLRTKLIVECGTEI